MLINTEDTKQLKEVRKFLINFRNDFNEYNSDSKLKHQAISNTIELLFNKIRELDNNYFGIDTKDV